MNLAKAAASQILTGGALSALLTGSGSNYATLVLYAGTQPATPETALSGNTAMGTWQLNQTTPLGSPSFSSPNEVAAISFVASQVTLSYAGGSTLNASFARLYKSDGTTVVADLTVGVGTSYDINLSQVALASGTAVNLSSGSIGVPAV